MLDDLLITWAAVLRELPPQPHRCTAWPKLSAGKTHRTVELVVDEDCPPFPHDPKICRSLLLMGSRAAHAAAPFDELDLTLPTRPG